MTTVVYVDVLIFINTIITYAVLLTAEKLLKRRTKLWRLVAASLIGSLFSLLVFIGTEGFLFQAFIKAISSLSLTALAFPIVSRREFLRTALVIVGVSVAYSGMFILIYQLFKPPNMLILNDYVYFEFNPVVLLISTAVIYAVMALFQKLFHERIKSTVVPLRFTVGGTEYSCVGKVDTGCTLTEPFSGAPVIIADPAVFSIPDDSPGRVIPYSAVGGSSILYAVRADRVMIDRTICGKEVYIASSSIRDDHIQAIINSEIVR